MPILIKCSCFLYHFLFKMTGYLKALWFHRLSRWPFQRYEVVLFKIYSYLQGDKHEFHATRGTSEYLCEGPAFYVVFLSFFDCSCSSMHFLKTVFLLFNVIKFRCSRVITLELSKAFTVPRVKTSRRHWRTWQTNLLHSVQHWTSTQGSDTRSKPRWHFLTNVSNQSSVRFIWLW